ncbi:AI-2E family transporter [Catenovulum sp. SM1970]|uniref:AI-2E family transporter n=1 Tax=Marinifaba aquimaris TaxID=2741323 RepID=UPI001571AF74|nr:AI-2E family transporter [Marinifaba aquimaris]
MFEIIKSWYQNRFSDPDAVTLALIILLSFAIAFFVGDILAPVFVAIVIAYLLEWPVSKLCQLGCRRTFAVVGVLILFLWLTIMMFVGLVPLIWQQASHLINESPQILAQAQDALLTIPEEYPTLVSAEQVTHVIEGVSDKIISASQSLITASFESLVTLMALLIYLVLVPLMVFFMLKDKSELVAGIVRFLPNQRKLAVKVWHEMNGQIGNYIQGKVIEILIVGIASVIVFLLLDLRYAVLLGVAVGLSVLIPYIGAAVVTIPVAVVALFQFGISAEFWYVMIAYGIIQAIDGNVIVPLLFSQAVNLHPVVIIIAVLFFGGLWGFWGIFFAIPLATLIKAILNAWPNMDTEQEA